MNFKALLGEIIKKEAYRPDYENITFALLFEKLSYDDAVTALEKILNSKLFD